MPKFELREGAPLVNEINTYTMAGPEDVTSRPKPMNRSLNLFHAIGQFHTGRRYTLDELEPDAPHCFSDHARLFETLLSERTSATHDHD